MKRISLAIIATIITISAAGQTRRMAVTGLSENNLRAEADYTSELCTQTLMGTVVEIVGESGYWRQVVTPEPYTAWCTDLGLTEMRHDKLSTYLAAPKYICTAMHSSVRKEASADSEPLSDLSMGDLTRIVTKSNGSASTKKGWAEVMLPCGETGWAPLADIAEFSSWASTRKADEENIIKTAKGFLGIPYLWGGASAKGLDCSGLVRLVWFMNGYLIPRNASQQATLGREIIVEADHSITPDSYKMRDEMLLRTKHIKPGDLIFFGTPGSLFRKESITHVGIYLGKGRFIHASHQVRISSLIPGEDDYYMNSFKLIKVRRLFGWQGAGMTPVSHSPAYFLTGR